MYIILHGYLCIGFQLNKVIDENSSLRNSIVRSPPATSSSPPPMEQIHEEIEGGEQEGSKDIPLYAQVDKSKVELHVYTLQWK